MDYVYRYGDPSRLYLNVTNRCTNRCSFCVRNQAEGLGDALLRGPDEPDLKSLLEAIGAKGGPGAFSEFVWCGFGEPTFRLDLILEAAPHLRAGGAKIRLNTNGHASLLQDRDVLPALGRAVDEVSLSLNAPNRKRYLALCRPDPTTIPGKKSRHPSVFWEAMLDFAIRSRNYFGRVQATVVGSALKPAEVEESRRLAHMLGIDRFRVR